MVAVGVLYLIFEKKLLSKSKLPGDSTEAANNSLSRSLIGAQVSRHNGTLVGQANTRQVGFIILAMVVTRSSALSLQAKMGLPRGNQIVGWNVLGMLVSILCNSPAFADLASAPAHNAFPSPPAAQQPLPSSFNGYIPDIFSNLCHPHHLLRGSVLSRILRHLDHMGSTRE